jgi:hypothetical protein
LVFCSVLSNIVCLFVLFFCLFGFQSTDYHVVIFKLSYDKLLQVIEG